MRKLVLSFMAGASLFLLVGMAGAQDEDASVLTAAVIVREGDFHMRLAQDCLTQIRESKANDGETVLVKVLAATGFKLEKVVAKEFKGDSRRIRFGFEFGNAEELQTVYWETDCPIGGTDEHLASR